MYEPSLRVPGFIFDPRRPGGITSKRLVITTDFAVTLLALAGVERPDDMTGRDLMTLLSNPEADWRGDLYYDHPYAHGGAIPRTVGVRTERYVYTRYIDPDPRLNNCSTCRPIPINLTTWQAIPRIVGCSSSCEVAVISWRLKSARFGN